VANVKTRKTKKQKRDTNEIRFTWLIF